MKHTRHTFSLIELMVVVSIIALLVALLLPVLSKTREKANQVKCAGQMKQISLALIMYANEHNAWFPGDTGPYVAHASAHQRATNDLKGTYENGYLAKIEKIWGCPSAPVMSVDGSLSNYYYRGYGYATSDERSTVRSILVDAYENHNKVWTTVAYIDGHVDARKYIYYPFYDDTVTRPD